MGTQVDGGSGQLPASLRTFLLFEQQNLWNPGRLRFPVDDTAFDSRYLPESCATFELPSYWVRRKHLFVYGKPSERIASVVMPQGEGPDDLVLLVIHPAEFGGYEEFLESIGGIRAVEGGLRLMATPTSSMRTLLAWPDGRPELAFFAKLSLRSPVLGDRRLDRRRVASSVGLSQVLRQCVGRELPELRVFPETFGLVPRKIPDRGVIFREIPNEITRGSAVPAPLFSLMGSNGKRQPLLLQLMEAESFRFRDFIEEVLLAGFARTWIRLALDFGILLEAHAQDLLLVLRPDLVPSVGMYYRDCEGLAFDWELRRAKGLSEPSGLPNSFEWHLTYETWGYPLYQLASRKIMISLFDYVELVLGELESAILAWQAAGVWVEETIEKGELTIAFGCHLRNEIHREFGALESEEYDIRAKLGRFVKFMMQVRREILIQHASAAVA